MQFLTSDELAPVVDSNSSRDSTGGMEDRFPKVPLCLLFFFLSFNVQVNVTQTFNASCRRHRGLF